MFQPILDCESDKCYVIDSSGYIVVSTDIAEVGTFFGALPTGSGVMYSFLNDHIFDHVEVFNYQALCPVDILKDTNSGWSLSTVLFVLKYLKTI